MCIFHRSKKARMPLIEVISETKFSSDSEGTPCDLLKLLTKEETSSTTVPDFKIGYGKISSSQKLGHLQKVGNLQKTGGSHKSSHRKTSTGLKHSSRRHGEKVSMVD